MDILGIGGAELIAILIVMLVVAGPKRMIQWAYVLGTYMAKLRAMWAEVMSAVQQELKESGVDVELPKELPKHGNLNRQFNQQVQKVMSPVTKPIEDTLKEASVSVNTPNTQSAVPEGNGAAKPKPQPSAPPPNDKSDFGSWSGGSSE
ncbi:MAG: hypothetical protein K8L97_26030 [Anaerolineae bacterium]|nr:hypothetical protein [Anaerolineae bacterium]